MLDIWEWAFYNLYFITCFIKPNRELTLNYQIKTNLSLPEMAPTYTTDNWCLASDGICRKKAQKHTLDKDLT